MGIMSGKSGKKDVKKGGSATVTHANFKITQIRRILKSCTGMRVSKIASLAVSIAVGYVCLEIIEGGKNKALDDGNKKKISPKHLKSAIQADPELQMTFKNVIIQSGGASGFTLPKELRKN